MARISRIVALTGLGLFLLIRLADGTLFFYIHRRFAWLTLLAVLGLLLMAVSLGAQPRAARSARPVAWGELAWMALPVVLGVLVSPRPLGATAMSMRWSAGGALTSLPAPGRPATLTEPETGERTILGWLVAFDEQDAAEWIDEPVRVVGFVYRDDSFEDDTFVVSRFLVSCCVADAFPIGLTVRWPGAAALSLDEWVEVQGHFQIVESLGQRVPLLVAERVTPVDPPQQPYLYP